MKFSLASLFCLLLSVPVVAQISKTRHTNDPFLQIDSVLTSVLKDQHIAGFAVAVVKGDQVIYSKGFGYRDLENKKPVTTNTLFAIGSSSKAFTASLLGLLKKEGKLTFEDKAVDLLPQLRFYNNEMNNQIILRDLMAHRTGLSRYDLSWYLFNTKNRDSIISRVRYMQPSAAVREKWFYNNFMYLAQGMIAERFSGKTWEQNIQEKFFIPLEMTRSNTDIIAFQNDSDAALPYTVEDNAIKKIDYYNINGMGPAGSINSSVNDMANWLKIWINEGSFKGKEIVPKNYITEAMSSQMVMSADLPDKHSDIFLANYGLGWMIGSYRGHYLVEHGGNINGFSANVAFFPSDKLGIVVLTNQNVSKVPMIICNSIADKIFNLKPVDWNGEVKAATAAKALQAKKEIKKMPVPNTKPSHPLKEYAGSYTNLAYGTIKITFNGKDLYTKLKGEKIIFKHFHYDVFDPRAIDKNGKVDTDQSDLMFNFTTNVEGKIQGIELFLDGNEKPVLFDRDADKK